MSATDTKRLIVGAAGAMWVTGALACGPDQSPPRAPETTAGTGAPAAAQTGTPAAAKAPVVYDRTGKPLDCAPNKSTPANPVACPPIAPDTAFIKACEAASYKTVMCGDCWVACSGKVQP